MPVIGNRYDFWIVLGIMAIISLTMIFVFKSKKVVVRKWDDGGKHHNGTQTLAEEIKKPPERLF